MENNNTGFKYCPHCGTALEQDYMYCPSCGRATNVADYNNGTNTEDTGNTGFTPDNANVGFNPNGGLADNIDGVPVAEINDYVGKNTHKFIPKFFKHSYGSKANWNWPTFLFGLLLGMPFIWFFYRRMNKIGAIVLAVTLALSLGSVICIGTVFDGMKEPFADYIESMSELDRKYGYDQIEDFEAIDESEYDPEYTHEVESLTLDFLEDVMSSNALATASTVSQLLSYLQLGFVIAVSIFADYWYYKKTMTDLKRLNANGYPNGYTVQMAGGTKAWVPILIAIGMFVLLAIAFSLSIVPFIISIVESVMETV